MRHANHSEFNQHGKGLAVMSFENPAVSYCLVETNQRVRRYRVQNPQDSKFYQMLSQVIMWEKAPELPSHCDEYYHVLISIMGTLCVMDVELGRCSVYPAYGFIKVLKIDDTDENLIDTDTEMC